jgi:hypothetical protein
MVIRERDKIQIVPEGTLKGEVMTSKQSFPNQKVTRTQITDLPEIAAELSERELRIVSGGLTASAMACSPLVRTKLGALATNVDGDHVDWV